MRLEEYQLILLDAGSATIYTQGGEYNYNGFVNKEGEAFGYGSAYNAGSLDCGRSIEGTFYKNQAHGISKISDLLV